MEPYISKSALVTEIQKRRHKHFNSGGSPSSEYCHEDDEILGIIDALEVTEVDEEPYVITQDEYCAMEIARKNIDKFIVPKKQEESGYQQGYEQAEKDLELTWKDMMLIHRYIKDAMNYHLYKIMEGAEGQKVVYQEVLKRFKEQRT